MNRFRKTSIRLKAKEQSGFSLIELLVVIAILALLLSLLVPSLHRAKDVAKVTACQARLRNVGISLHLYAAVNNDAFPVSDFPYNPHSQLVSAMVDGHSLAGENLYCPSQTAPECVFSRENIEAGNIGYFYYSCKNAASYSSQTSKVLRNFGGITPNWPRQINTSMAGDTWVMSDFWLSNYAAHPFGKKGMNYLLLDGSVKMIEAGPAAVFK